MNGTWQGPIAIIGAGQLGSSLLEGLVRLGVEPSTIHAATRTPAHAEHLAERFGVIPADAASAAAQASSIIIISVRPDQVVNALDEIHDQIQPGAIVVSMAANPDLATLAAHLPPGTPLVRVMPNPAMAVNASLTGICPADDCPPAAVAKVRALFSVFGSLVDVPESQIGLIGSLAGHGQAVVYYVADAMVQWGVLEGFSRAQARTIVAGAIAGASKVLNETTASPNALQNRVTTPGGSTVKAMTELDAQGVRAAVIECMDGGRYARR